GEGGMGRVWLARQQRPQREVALKLMRAGLVSNESGRRFERESEILGALHHPGIAEIYAAGLQEIDGTSVPWFAMECIRGLPIVHHAGQHGLDDAARVRLFVRLCEALAHAHDNGIVHRDLKPANILVTREGQPKILDFGVARTIESDLAATMLTRDGQVVGTLAYMSPEQTEGSAASRNRGTDIYSLGVILFELLCGRRPQEFADIPPIEAMRRIRDEDPLSLSSVNRRFSGDLDTIVGTCLEKNPAKRYASAWLLADDLRRHLNHEPILARKPNALDRSVKFLRRHRLGAVALTFVFLGLGLGIVGAWRGKTQAEASAQRERAAAHEARAALGRYERVLGFLDDSLAALDIATTGREVPTLEAFADEVARGLDQGLTEDRDSRIALLTTLGNAYSGIGRHDDALRVLKLNLEERRATYDDALVTEGLYHLARHLVRERAFDAARPLVEEARTLPPTPHGVGRRSRILLLSGLLEFLAGEHDLAREIFAQAADELDADPEASVADRMLLARHTAKLDTIQWRIDEAIVGHRACLAQSEAILGPDHPRLSEIQLDLAEVLLAKGAIDEAESEAEAALARLERRFGRRDAILYRNLVVPGVIRLEQGRFDEAETYLRRLLETSMARGESDDTMAHTRGALAGVLLQQGDHDEAYELLTQAIVSYERIWPRGHYTLANALVNLASLDMARRDPRAALEHAEAAWVMAQDNPGANIDAKAGNQMARILRAFGRTKDAVIMQQQVVDRLTERKGADARDTIVEALLLGSFQFDAGYHEAAVETLQVLDHFEAGIPRGLEQAVAISRRSLGAALAALDRLEEAEPVLARALEECRALGPRGEPLVAEVSQRLSLVREEL
ncbi:MAG: serine/threonine protein kinase, partial [Planctomycetes bacterium]|nr:serine/threonine protein kinase [Planctomycetota bacterium]